MSKDNKSIPQHKRMAMGDMPKVTGNSGRTGFEQDGGATKGRTNIPSGKGAPKSSGKGGY